jgi:hypothetical protein
MLKNDVKKLILKPALGLMGKDIFFVSSNNVDVIEQKTQPQADVSISNNDEYSFIVQEFIKQHPEMDRINPYSVNSIRIITLLCRDDTVTFLAAMLRTSSSTYPIDNFSAGGIVIGIDMKTGKLRKEGFKKPPYGTTVIRHPVTGIEFHDFEIPYWHELKILAAKAQRTFRQLKSIGWDLAITLKGPVIIEGNQQWGTAGIQAANGGLLTPKNRALFAQHGLRFYE